MRAAFTGLIILALAAPLQAQQITIDAKTA